MRDGCNRKLIFFILLLVCLTTGYPLAQAAEDRVKPAMDATVLKWKARAELATKKLATSGLDQCDQAMERGFEQFNVSPINGGRLFQLDITVAGKTLKAAYSYSDSQLDAFILVALPPRWMVVQKNGSKTLNVLINDANCALDLCSIDPYAEGGCP